MDIGGAIFTGILLLSIGSWIEFGFGYAMITGGGIYLALGAAALVAAVFRKKGR